VVTAGIWRTCALATDDTLWCWGANDDGVLGIGTSPDASTPAPVSPGVRWRELAFGNTHTCGIRADGTLWCWGQGTQGELGNGMLQGRAVAPLRVDSNTDWEHVTAGGGFACGVRREGGVRGLWCWGSNDHGMLGLGSLTPAAVAAPARLDGDGWASISAGDRHLCALRGDGTLWCFGRNDDGQLGTGQIGVDALVPTEVGGATDWQSVAAGFMSTCGVRAGELWCWGSVPSATSSR
jgi:alpha-tubulin suppressor-like RCC1 family protein